ncbi:MAG: glycosyltransferase family 2 protein [Candidatus Bathyarchaeia archaeon]
MREFELEKKSVSVIVPTCESEAVIEFCLRSVLNQSWPVCEVLVVDCFSRDHTREIASMFGVSVVLARGTQAAARNIGLKLSKGEYVFFLDSDQCLDFTVVETCVRACVVYGFDAMIIREVFVGQNFWSISSAFWKNSMVKACGPRGGIPRFFRKDILLASGAFDVGMRFWDDLALYQRLKSMGAKVGFCDKKIVHYEEGSLRRIVQKYYLFGQSIAKFKSMPPKAYTLTFQLTLATITQVLRSSASFSVFCGCFLLFALKSLSAVLGLFFKLFNK